MEIHFLLFLEIKGGLQLIRIKIGRSQLKNIIFLEIKQRHLT